LGILHRTIILLGAQSNSKSGPLKIQSKNRSIS
jgi:hypothetical protein